MTLRILIADDHPVVRKGLNEMLAAEPGFAVVAQARDGHEAVELSGRVAWDVAVVDYNLPGKDGIEVLKELRRRHPGRPVLVLSMYPEERYALRVLKAGAAGYLTKESAPEALVGAIRKAMRGGRYVSPALGELLANDLGGARERPPHEALSDREFQIMSLLAAGGKVGEIARRLFLSPNTVSGYRTQILRKMNLRNTAELVRYAIRHQLVD
jgi:DNA-binding NarL/FixJ family response regulator